MAHNGSIFKEIQMQVTNLKDEICQVTGLVPMHADWLEIAKYSVDRAMCGPLWDKFASDPLKDLLNYYNLPTTIKEELTSRFRYAVSENVFGQLDENIEKLARDISPGLSMTAEWKGGFNYIHHYIYNEDSRCYSVQSLTRPVVNVEHLRAYL